MDLELADRVVIVTGASAGIGRATVELLAAEGARVVGAARNTDGLDGPQVTAFSVDLTAPHGPDELVRATLARHGRLDGLVNNVGGGGHGARWVPLRRRRRVAVDPRAQSAEHRPQDAHAAMGRPRGFRRSAR